APAADQVHHDADQHSIDQLATISGGGAYRIGGDKEGSQHGGAAEQMHQWRTQAFRTAAVVVERRQQREGGEHGERYMPTDHLFVEQVQSAHEKAAIDPFPTVSRPASHHRIARKELTDQLAAMELPEAVQRG